MSNTSPTKSSRFHIPSADDIVYEYTASDVGSLYFTTSCNAGLSDKARHASARATLRHNVSVDNNHWSVRRKGGLHPMYLALHGNGEASGRERKETERLLRDTCKDVFDAVSVAVLYFFSI
jgi:hypothetical protein